MEEGLSASKLRDTTSKEVDMQANNPEASQMHPQEALFDEQLNVISEFIQGTKPKSFFELRDGVIALQSVISSLASTHRESKPVLNHELTRLIASVIKPLLGKQVLELPPELRPRTNTLILNLRQLAQDYEGSSKPASEKYERVRILLKVALDDFLVDKVNIGIALMDHFTNSQWTAASIEEDAFRASNMIGKGLDDLPLGFRITMKGREPGVSPETQIGEAIRQVALTFPAYTRSALHVVERCSVLICAYNAFEAYLKQGIATTTNISSFQIGLWAAEEMILSDLNRILELFHTLRDRDLVYFQDADRMLSLFNHAYEYLLLPRIFVKDSDEALVRGRGLMGVCANYDKNCLLAALRHPAYADILR